MADPKKISQLTTAGPLTGVELLPIVQNSGTLQTNLATVAIFATSAVTNDVAAVSLRLDQVSAAVSANTAAITSVNAVVSALEVRVSAVSAAAVSLSSALTSTNNVVSALEVRVSAASATGAANAAAITSINNVVSVLEIRVSAVSAAVTSVNNVVSVLDVRLTAVSASVSVLNVQMLAVQASISAINSVLANINASALAAIEPRVSALEIRVAAVSASVSALQVQVNAVSVLTSINTAAITSVNAVISTKAFRNGDHLTNVQYIDFNTTTSYAPTAGRLTWDIEYGTLDLGLTGTVNLLIGQRTVAQVYNNTGATLLKDKAVRVTGAQGQRLTAALAQADSDADSLTIFGVMLETVSVNRSGYVATDGVVRNFNTGSYADGDILYLSPVSAGELTITKPVAPQHLVQVGYVVNGGSVGAGSIYIKVQNGYELGELHDVKTSSSTSLATGEVLAWNAGANVWTNSTALIEAQASISALNVQLAAVSARTSVNAAAITSINNVVSALEIRVSAVSAAVSVNTVAINAVSAAVSLRVLRIGDRMTGPLIVDVSSASAAVRITQTGAGNALLVEDSTNPDSSPVVVDASGLLITGATTNQAANLATGNARVQILGGTAPLALYRDADSSTAINLEFAKRRATGGLLANNDTIGRLYFSGNDGTAAIPAAFIDAAVDGTPGTNDMPGRLVFATTPDGASTPTERMRITNAGNVGIGTTGPAVRFAVSATDAILVPVGTTGQRPTGATGYFRFNSTTGSFEGHNGTDWGSVGGGGATGGGSNQAFYLNDTVVSVSYSIPSGKNAGTFGPVTIATGVTVEVPSGSTWTVV